jgi:hypothetical protein
MDQASLVAATIGHECENEPDLMRRIQKAMKAARNHWIVLDENDQFRGAIAAAIIASEGAERDRIKRSAKALGRLGALFQALQAGLPVDLEGMAAEKQDEDLIPLRKLWDEAA